MRSSRHSASIQVSPVVDLVEYLDFDEDVCMPDTGWGPASTPEGQMLSFDQPYQGKEKFDVAISDDKRALTLTFQDFQLNHEGGKSAQPVASRVFTTLIPVGGDEKRVQIAFGINAFAVTTEGATATIVLSVNGQTTVADFAGNCEESIVQQLEFNGDKPSECRLCIFLLVGLDSKIPMLRRRSACLRLTRSFSRDRLDPESSGR